MPLLVLDLFPPRYAGMEGSGAFRSWHGPRFPRATRGWKTQGRRAEFPVFVSPALRGDGRDPAQVDMFAFDVSPALRGDGRGYLHRLLAHGQFPPRYAGMEGRSAHRAARGGCFPRATRGWKTTGLAPGELGAVSPALRGDGREPPLQRRICPGFPPRYAGMEGEPRQDAGPKPGFPRATRGWKGRRDWTKCEPSVSPALRGDGRRPRSSRARF